MILVLEGTNQSGKTTFANKLKRVARNRVIVLNSRELVTNNQPNKQAVAYGFNFAAIEMAKAIEENDKNAIVVFDRFHLSELIYGRCQRGYENANMYKTDCELQKAGAVGIYFKSDTSYERSGKEQYTNMFDEEVRKSNMKWVTVNLDTIKGDIDTEVARSLLMAVAGQAYER